MMLENPGSTSPVVQSVGFNASMSPDAPFPLQFLATKSKESRGLAAPAIVLCCSSRPGSAQLEAALCRSQWVHAGQLHSPLKCIATHQS